MLDRNKGELIDFIVGDNRIENAYLLMHKILTNNENKNFNIDYRDTLNTIDYLCTDGHHAYEKVADHPLFKHNIKHHIVSKSEIQSPSYASLLAITNLLLSEARSQTMMCLHNHCSLSFGKVPKRLQGARSMR